MSSDIVSQYASKEAFYEYTQGRLQEDKQFMVPPVNAYHGHESPSDYLAHLLQTGRLNSEQIDGFWTAISELIKGIQKNHSPDMISLSQNIYRLLVKIPVGTTSDAITKHIQFSDKDFDLDSERPAEIALFLLCLALRYNKLETSSIHARFYSLASNEEHFQYDISSILLKLIAHSDYRIRADLWGLLFQYFIKISKPKPGPGILIQAFTSEWLKAADDEQTEQNFIDDVLEGLERACCKEVFGEHLIEERAGVKLIKQAFAEIVDLPFYAGNSHSIEKRALEMFEQNKLKATASNPKAEMYAVNQGVN